MSPRIRRAKMGEDRDLDRIRTDIRNRQKRTAWNRKKERDRTGE
jgi:hypothetical protein